MQIYNKIEKLINVSNLTFAINIFPKKSILRNHSFEYFEEFIKTGCGKAWNFMTVLSLDDYQDKLVTV